MRLTQRILFACVAVTSALTQVFAQSVRHVDGIGGNDAADGLTWASAVQTIGRAVAIAAPGDTIYVKQGTYLITAPIAIAKELSLYGGFVGTESSPQQRDLTQHSTIVDGQNLVIHVFSFDSTTGLLDGFTARRGYANGSGTGTVGGGFLGYNSTLVVRNCTFRECFGTLGGGGFDTWLSNITVENCRFESNSSVAGAGIRCRESTSQFTNCVLVQNNSNVTNGKGGGMYFWNSTVTVTGCLFVDNQSKGGGGIATSGGHLTVVDSTFEGNLSASQGGGIQVSGGGLFVDQTVFNGNQATFGGAIAGVSLDSGSVISAVRAMANLTDRGGALYFASCPGVDVVNCVLVGNEGVKLGGGIYMQASAATFTHCTVAQNVSARGAGSYCDGTSQPVIQDCIFWNNSVTTTSPSVVATKELTAPVSPMPYVVRYSDVEQSGFAGANGNISSDPVFQAPGHINDAGTPADPYDDTWVDGDYSLLAGSPCIDAGSNVAGIVDDLAGNARPQGNGPDMGAYELSAADHAAPTVLSCVGLPGSVTLGFSEAVDPISAGLTSNFSISPAASISGATVSGDTVTLAVLHPGDGTYTLTVQNVSDLAGNVMSTTARNYTIDTTPPTAPGSLTASPGTTSVDLAWTASSDANGIAGYSVYRDGALLGTTTSTTYTDANLAPDTSYAYRITATDLYGNTADATVSATTQHVPTYPLTVTAEHGHVDRSPSLAEYPAGTAVGLTAVADSGYLFSHWEGAASGSNVSTSVTILGPTSVTAVFVAQPPGPSDQGLTARWSFDEGSGTSSLDQSGRGNHAVLMNGAGWTNGISGTAAQFDGVNDYADLGTDGFALTGECTVSLWLNPAVSGGRRMVVFQRGPYIAPVMIDIESDRRLRVGIRPVGAGVSYAYSTTTISAGAWYHVALTWTGGQLRLYVNGLLDASSTTPGTALDLSGSVLATLGSTPLIGSPYAGALDEVRIYNRALSAAEVTALAVPPVISDTQPPALSGVDATALGVVFSFSEGVDPASVSPGNFASSPSLPIGGVSVDHSEVTLAVTHPGDGTYQWTVQGISDLAGNVMAPTVISYTLDATAPVFSGPVTTSTTETTVQLSWSAATDASGIASYRVLRDGVEIAQTTTTSYADTQLTPGTTYAYVIRALDTFGNAAELTASATTVAAPTFTLDVAAQDGHVDVSPFQASYLSGTTVTLIAVPDTGFVFDHWEGALTGTNASAQLVITANTTVTAVFVPQPPGVSTAGLQGEWHLDEGTGDSSWDASGNGNHAVLMNGAAWTTSGVNGSGVVLDGVNDSLDLGSSTFSLASELTISLWCKATTMGSRMILVQRGAYVAPFVLNIESNRKIRFGVRTVGGSASYLTSNTVLSPNVWYHVAVTYTSGQRCIYINGQLDKSDTLSGALDSGTAAANTVAGISPLGTGAFAGCLDETRIYSRVLAPSEILWLFGNHL